MYDLKYKLVKLSLSIYFFKTQKIDAYSKHLEMFISNINFDLGKI